LEWMNGSVVASHRSQLAALVAEAVSEQIPPRVTSKQRLPTTRAASWTNSASAASFQTVMRPVSLLAKAAVLVNRS